MSLAASFSPDYLTARSRFREAARACKASLEAHAISARGPEGEELTIDAALLGPADAARAVIVSSGLHGAEGPFGSAVQLALLEKLSSDGPPPIRAVLLHGLNPYGFAWRRRWNENNIDLNRNWLRPGEPFRGSPPLYARLDPIFNPKSAPGPLDPFTLKIALAAVRFGVLAIRQALPAGQYDYPRGLFFGGHGPAETQAVVRAHLGRWVGSAGEILHLDFHTGLGRFGTYRLLLEPAGREGQEPWFHARFGQENVSAVAASSGPAYPTRGSWGSWCAHALPGRTYRFATAEFGTYGPIRVLAALGLENRAHFYCRPGSPQLDRAKRRLLEVFCPSSRRWRERVVEQGLAILEEGLAEG